MWDSSIHLGWRNSWNRSWCRWSWCWSRRHTCSIRGHPGRRMMMLAHVVMIFLISGNLSSIWTVNGLWRSSPILKLRQPSSVTVPNRQFHSILVSTLLKPTCHHFNQINNRISLLLVTGKKVLFKAGNLTELEMFELYNKYITPHAPEEEKQRETLTTKAMRKGKKWTHSLWETIQCWLNLRVSKPNNG